MIAPRPFHPLNLVLAVGLMTMVACGTDDGVESGAAPSPTESSDTSSEDNGADTAPDDAAPDESAADERAAEDPSTAAVPFTDAELVTACLEEPASQTPATTEPGILADADGLRYCVGPALQVGIESAVAVDAPFGPSIEPVLTEAGIEAFNLLAGECFDPTIGKSSCPSSQVAIVTDGGILSAPTINAPEFARDQLVISGGFTIEEAGVIADALAAEQMLTIRPVLLALGPDGP